MTIRSAATSPKAVETTARRLFPLTYPPGQHSEGDFGHICVEFPDGRQLVSVLLLTWSYSSFRFAAALPSERTEAILDGS